MLQITSAKVTASPGGSGWVQIHSFSPSEDGQVKSRGQLFVVIASKNGSDGIEAISFERKIVGEIREEYYGSQESKTFDALAGAIQKVVSEIKNTGQDIEIACCAFADGVVYSSASGGGRVMIKRGEALASILESSIDVISASGFPKSGDSIIVGTKAFFEKVNLTDLKNSLRDSNPNAAVEELTPLVYGGKEVGTAGAIIIKFEEAAVFDQPEEVSPPLQSEVAETPATRASAPKVDVGKKLSEFFGSFTSRIPKRNIYIRPGMQDQATSQSRKLTLSVGIILLAILAVSIGFGIKQKKANDVKKQYQGLFAEANSGIDQAISLASSDPEGSRQLFLTSEQKLTQIQALNVKDPKIEELQKKIEDSRAAVLGEYTAITELFLDLGLLSSGLKGDAISASGGNLYVLDKNGPRVVSVAISTKKSKVVSGPTVIDAPQDLASYEDNVYVLLSDGIYLTDSTKTKVVDKTWNGEAKIYSFGGNLYVLDKSGGAIYRYSGQPGNTFGPQQSWLSSSTKADFSGVLGWGMNGAVYVLYPNSRILKYSLGSPQNFTLSGIIPEIGNVDALYADPDNTYVYLLDKAGKRVVVIDKNGKYNAQYISDQISEATGLVVSEADKKIILLAGEKLLSIELKNI